MDATCTNCGRLVAGPALSIHLVAELVEVHQGRVFRASGGQVESDWLICPDCRQKAENMSLPVFFRVVANDLAKKTGR